MDKAVTFERIDLRTAPTFVEKTLRDRILDGSLPPGTALREVQLSKEMGVSRAPVREALARLASEGLVDQVPYRGSVVSETSPKAAYEIATVRLHLEPLAIELMKARLTSAVTDQLEQAVAEMDAAADEGNLADAIDAHMRFHRVFYEQADHELLLQMWSMWESQLRKFFAGDHQLLGDLHDLASTHRDFMHEVMMVKGAKLEAAVKRHLEDALQLP